MATLLMLCAAPMAACGDDAGTSAGGNGGAGPSGGSDPSGGGGAPGCSAGLTDCGGACVDTGVDASNCGACGTVCDPGEVCDGSGECALSCQTGLTDCNGTCTNTDSDNGNCGGCGAPCDPGEVCNGSGACALSCQTGLTDCNGTCTDTDSDNANCGGCGAPCDPGEVCNGSGVCALSCQTGLTDCNGTCTNTSFDPDNCGSCSLPCGVDEACVDGGCEALASVDDVLIVTGNAAGSFDTCVAAGLDPFFDTVTLVSGVPTPAQLAAHDAVLVFNNGDHADTAALGNAMADFFDANGHVVEALYGTGGLGGMTGRWSAESYPVLGGNWSGASVSLGVVSEPASPLMLGVVSFSATRSVSGAALNGGIVVASYNNGQPLIVRGTKNGRNRVDLAMFPGGCNGGSWTGNGFELMRNALVF
jgi:hypothetical protein